MHSWLLLAEAATPKGGLFDLDATLPLMAVQVVVLTFILNALFFRPVGKTVEDREGYISTSRVQAKEKLAQAERLEAELKAQLLELRGRSRCNSSASGRATSETNSGDVRVRDEGLSI